MPIFKIQNKTNYAAIPNDTLRDKRLSIESRGVLAYLLTHSDTFDISLEFLQKELSVGRDKLKKIIHELKVNGYLSMVAAHNKKGAFSGQEWFVYAESQGVNFAESGTNRPTEKPSDGKTDRRENRPTENTSDILKEKLEQKKSLIGTEEKEHTQNAHVAPVREITIDSEKEKRNDFKQIVFSGIAAIHNLKSLPDKTAWIEPLEWAFEQGISPPDAIEVYSLMHKQKWRTSRIKPETWKNNIPNLENLRKEIAEQNGIIQQNNNFKSSADKRDERAISSFERKQQLRAKVEARRIGIS